MEPEVLQEGKSQPTDMELTDPCHQDLLFRAKALVPAWEHSREIVYVIPESHRG